MKAKSNKNQTAQTRHAANAASADETVSFPCYVCENEITRRGDVERVRLMRPSTKGSMKTGMVTRHKKCA